MKPEVSIILNLYDVTRHLRRFTETCLWAIYQYTDPEDYEIILIDNAPKFEMNPHFGLPEDFVNQLREKWMVNKEDVGCYPSLNQGAKLAEGKYLCFMENDIIVSEGWLNKMKYYLDKDMTDAIIPDEFPRSREFRKKSYTAPLEDYFVKGPQEQSMMMIKREAFDKIGGWDERFWSWYGHKAFFVKAVKVGVRIDTTLAVPIHHVFQSSLDAVNELEGEKQMSKQSAEAKIIAEEY